MAAPLRIPSHAAVAFLALVLAACAPPEHAPHTPLQLPVLALSQKPTLQIGVMEGDAHYTFASVADVLPLPSGEIVVSDGGAQELTLYSPEGTFVRRWGGRGQGPGEFRALSRLYPGTGDSILALDNVTQRVSVFDTAGDYAREMPVRELSGDSVFPGDVWLYGRFWVDGAMAAGARARVRQALDELPPPRSAPGYRVVRVASDGRLWAREPKVTAGGMRVWTVLSAAGEPQALIDIPERFEPQYLGAKRLLGRWRGESDVNFVRAYAVEKTGRQAPTPAWLAGPPDTTTMAPADEKEVRAQILAGVRSMAVKQEIYYAGHYSYTTSIDSLEWEPSGGLTADFVNAGPRGWAAVFTRPDFDRVCALAYGANAPAGWQPGMLVCAPPTSPTSTPKGS